MGVLKNMQFWKSYPSSPKRRNTLPAQYLCPISGNLMFEPVVVSSGQTFELASVMACRELDFIPPIVSLANSPPPDFSTFIRNLNLRSSILLWCQEHRIPPPLEPAFDSILSKVRSMKESSSDSVETLRLNITDPEIRVSKKKDELGVSVESPARFDALEPFPLATRPAVSFCSSSSLSSSDIQDSDSNSNQSLACSSSLSEEESIVTMLNSSEIEEQEKGTKVLRNLTRDNDALRVTLCSSELLHPLKSLIASRYAGIQINALAGLVNLSLENRNKLPIVRSGVVPILVDLLKSGSVEAQEHTAGALFSLALEDSNRMAIGTLGALEPLLHTLSRSESQVARNDSARALYNLSLVNANRQKLVRMDAVGLLVRMMREKRSISELLPILYNLAACNEGSEAMLSCNAVGVLVNVLREGGNSEYSALVKENCVATLFAMSRGSVRFRQQVAEAHAIEVLREIEQTGSVRAKEKASRLLTMMTASASAATDRVVGSDRVPRNPQHSANF